MISSRYEADPGLISMLANFRRQSSSVFGLFTQPEVREVVLEARGALKPSGFEPKTASTLAFRPVGAHAVAALCAAQRLAGGLDRGRRRLLRRRRLGR